MSLPGEVICSARLGVHTSNLRVYISALQSTERVLCCNANFKHD